MDRKEFLSHLGTASAALFAVGCFGSCGSDGPEPQPTTGNNGPGSGNPGGGTTKVDFTIDLNNNAYSLLKTRGNALVKDGVIIAFSNNGSYLAVSATCTHEGGALSYNAGGSQFNCSLHGSNFNENGSVVNGPATRALKQYQTTLTGNNLRVYEN